MMPFDKNGLRTIIKRSGNAMFAATNNSSFGHRFPYSTYPVIQYIHPLFQTCRSGIIEAQ
jgi:hypothetical protein